MQIKSKKAILSAILLGIISFIGCQPGKPDNFDYGRVLSNTYYNDFFKFELPIPPKWHVQSQSATDSLATQGAEMVAGDNKELKATLKAAEVNGANLLSVNKFPSGYSEGFNSSFIISAENISRALGINTSIDYLEASRKLLQESEVKYDSIDETATSEIIGGKEFFYINAEMTYNEVLVKQRFYSCIINGFSLNIIVTYTDEEQKPELLRAIQSMKFTD